MPHTKALNLTMTKAKTIVLMAKEPLIKARKLKPRDRETELFAKGVYCKSLSNLIKAESVNNPLDLNNAKFLDDAKFSIISFKNTTNYCL